MGVRAAVRAALSLLVALPGCAVVLAVAILVRLSRDRLVHRPRVVLSSTPIISLSLIAKALRLSGYQATTLVDPPYAINRRADFDLLIADLPPAGLLRRLGLAPVAHAIGPYAATVWTLTHADVLVCFFDGGPLAGAAIARWEPGLLRLAGCRSVVMPYGSDAFVASQVACLPWRNGILATYPQLGRDEQRIAARIRRWCAGADRVIACLVHRETLPRWDVLTTHYYPIDTTEWMPAPQHEDHDGRRAEVVVGHAPNHRGVKGTEQLITTINQLRREGLLIRLELFERVPNAEVRERLAGCDILVEQLHLGYALSAMEGMALARPVISNLTDDNYYSIHRQHTGLDTCPIVSCTPDTLAEELRRLAGNPALRQHLGETGRAYTERFHSLTAVGRFWDLLLRSLCGDGTLRREDLLVWHPERGYPDDHSW